MADLDQTDGHGYSGSFFPYQVTHGMIFSYSKNLIASPSDRFAALGIPFARHLGMGVSRPHVRGLQKMTRSELMHAQGNSMCLPHMACFFWFVLSGLLRRDIGASMFNFVNVTDNISDTDEDEPGEQATAPPSKRLRGGVAHSARLSGACAPSGTSRLRSLSSSVIAPPQGSES